MPWLLLAALAPLGAACAADLRWRIIPDWTVAALALAGAAIATSSATVLPSLLTGLACLLLGGLAAWRGLWGWGDAKLIGAAGIAAGTEGLLPLLLFTSLTGAALAAVLLLAQPLARRHLARPPHSWPRWLHCELRRLRRAPSVPYAIAIAAGLTGVLATRL